MARIHIFFLILIFSAGCLSQKQGISGMVFWVAGNQMPGPNKKSPSPQPIERDIYIYEPVKLSDTKRANGFYSEINAKLVTKVKSEPDGSFHITLPSGKYSVFVKEPGGFFATLLDGEGYINVIEVTKKEFSKTVLNVNYEAAY
jgi:hypothetical protein